jgi:signal transduction histidine kinase
MKFRWKVFLLCIGVYLITLLITGVLVTENSYASSLKKEIQRSLSEEDSFHFTMSLFLLADQAKGEEKLSLEQSSQRILELLETSSIGLEIYNRELDLLASNTRGNWPFEREELKQVLNGKRNYVLKWKDKQHYLFITDLVEINEDSLIISLIKDISPIDQQRKEQYYFFLQAGLLGFGVVVVLTGILSRLIIKPIESLTETVDCIAAGSYKKRVSIPSKDEVGLLAAQFNRMAEEIETRITLLEEEGERKQRFIDNLTHELRTPLTSIIGYGDLLLKIKYEEKTFQKGLAYIYAEGNRMLKLINSLMDLILLRESLIQLKPQPLRPLLWEVKGLMALKAREKGVSIEIEGDEAERPVDKDLFKAALINLTDNSLKASKPGSLVILGIKRENNQICIYVKDQGKGMEQEEVAKVLEPFYRADKSRSRQEGGIGLGLSICQEIVQVHGGRLEIDSEPGQGTIVKIII